MPRFAAAAALSALVLFTAAPALAQSKAPDAARVRTAAEQFDAGAGALKQRDFAAAASHFEAADAAVPSAEALRQAIRARMEAGQASRAATLAAQAIARYPGDDRLSKVAKEAIGKSEGSLHRVSVSCVSPCVLAVGTRSVPGEANTRWVVYLDPGAQTINASLLGGLSVEHTIQAKAGGSSEVRFDPDEKKGPAKPAPKVDAPPKVDATPDAPRPVEPDKPSGSKGIHPAFFGVAMGATAALGAVTIWSGVDTINNPGADAVRAGCVGQGTACALYQQGRSKQVRTNALIGATAGTAAVTVVLAIFTRWGGAKKPAQGGSALKPLAALPTLIFTDKGAVLGADVAF